MRIAVCEDNCAHQALLCGCIENHLARMGYAGAIECFGTAEALLEAFSPGAYDILFLDIFLPGASGVQAARAIRKADPSCLLLFITVSLDHAMDGFEVQASGYVVKPIDQEKIDKALYMCRDILAKSARTIEIPNGRDGNLRLPLGNIQYVEVYGKSSRFHLHGGRFEARLSLDEIEQALGGPPFLRCHRSYIVNMNHIARVEATDFVMASGERVSMRKNGCKEAKLAYARFLAGRPG